MGRVFLLQEGGLEGVFAGLQYGRMFCCFNIIFGKSVCWGIMGGEDDLFLYGQGGGKTGVRPSVSDENHVSVETYLYDFDMDMYGKQIVTEILDFKRPEIRFDSKEALKAQMEIDLLDGRKYHRI